MTAEARPGATTIRPDEPHLTVESGRGYAFTVGVRTRVGDDLEGLEAHGDGISFRSPQPLPGGERIELTICRAILVEAEVVGCAPLADPGQGYWIRARFSGTTPAMNALISEELNRMAQDVG